MVFKLKLSAAEFKEILTILQRIREARYNKGDVDGMNRLIPIVDRLEQAQEKAERYVAKEPMMTDQETNDMVQWALEVFEEEET